MNQLAIALATTPEEVAERMLRQYGGYLVELLQESDYNLLTFLDGIATSAG